MRSRYFIYKKGKGVTANTFGGSVFGVKSPDRIKIKGRKRDFYHNSFQSPFGENLPKNLMLMYDISDNFKKERDWLRRHLIKFDYIMIQKSVWVGPSPLPKEFLKYLNEIKIGDNFKTFKLAKSYSGRSKKIK